MKTVLVTGTSSGIGRAAVLKFNKEGWNVIATMRAPENEAVLNQLDHILIVALDVQKPETIAAAITAGIKKYGKIDAVVNNAGAAIFGVFEFATEDQINKIFDINVFGPMRVLRAILPYFRAQRSGTIINITSQGGRVTFPTCSIYHATKFSLEGLTEAISYELIPFGIKTKIIEPGSTATKFVGAAQLTANGDVPEYEQFINVGLGNWAKHDTMTSQPETIAETIFLAANEDTDQLRYQVGKDTALYIDKMQNGDDQAYIDYMRKRFIPEYLSPKP
ncbi:NADP-dependent 3-hydroxy acid dehydrogenase YdfG [Pedobacter psychrotolerans]|uniref:NADP-dependent 3-hydroxy acid dehydrogenase YdfG n=1 Tax=Pedobacter psychrotolerans TaxID=1843235 RepID=A0A4R2HL10_9SPHI|nr:SDR family oxidoreductase [Pedobacter psychrotolerans]TCO30740.1 NADP-dependent 3-hydroxy acid dehydrogenase YdfG [Pedobacter psychrotolerans]GGE44774.1 short-chain dehydrogenase/reductase [Pedobacter psychrotolerans]